MVLIFACVETNREKTMAKSSLTIAVALLFYLPVLSQQNDKALSFTHVIKNRIHHKSAFCSTRAKILKTPILIHQPITVKKQLLLPMS